MYDKFPAAGQSIGSNTPPNLIGGAAPMNRLQALSQRFDQIGGEFAELLDSLQMISDRLLGPVTALGPKDQSSPPPSSIVGRLEAQADGYAGIRARLASIINGMSGI